MGVIRKKNVSAGVRGTKRLVKKEKATNAHIINKVANWSIHEKIDIISSGISKSQLIEVKKDTGLDYETLSHVLAVTKATLHNKKGSDKFNTTVSERILLLADIYAYGIDVFGSRERFNDWLTTHIIALGNRRPVDRLNTTLGMQEIKQLIGRIDYGVYS